MAGSALAAPAQAAKPAPPAFDARADAAATAPGREAKALRKALGDQGLVENDPRTRHGPRRRQARRRADRPEPEGGRRGRARLRARARSRARPAARRGARPRARGPHGHRQRHGGPHLAPAPRRDPRRRLVPARGRRRRRPAAEPHRRARRRPRPADARSRDHRRRRAHRRVRRARAEGQAPRERPRAAHDLRGRRHRVARPLPGRQRRAAGLAGRRAARPRPARRRDRRRRGRLGRQAREPREGRRADAGQGVPREPRRRGPGDASISAGWGTAAGRLLGTRVHAFPDPDDLVGSGPDPVAPQDVGDWDELLVEPECDDGILRCTWTQQDRLVNEDHSATQLYYFVNTFLDHLATAPIGFTRRNRRLWPRRPDLRPVVGLRREGRGRQPQQRELRRLPRRRARAARRPPVRRREQPARRRQRPVARLSRGRARPERAARHRRPGRRRAQRGPGLGDRRGHERLLRARLPRRRGFEAPPVKFGEYLGDWLRDHADRRRHARVRPAERRAARRRRDHRPDAVVAARRGGRTRPRAGCSPTRCASRRRSRRSSTCATRC